MAVNVVRFTQCNKVASKLVPTVNMELLGMPKVASRSPRPVAVDAAILSCNTCNKMYLQ